MDFKRKLIKNEQEFNEMLNEIKNTPVIAIDTENTDLNPKFLTPLGFSLSVDGKTGYYIPINHTDIKTNFHKRFNEILENKKIIVMHNSVYDASVIKYQYKFNLENYFWFDTMIAQHLLNENDSKGLKYLTRHYFDYKQETFSEMLNGKNLEKVPAIQIYKYACDDAILTYKLYKIQKEKLKEEDLMDLYIKIEEPFQKVLSHIKLNGTNFDIDKCKKLEEDLKKEKENLIEEMLKVSPELPYKYDLFGKKLLGINLDSSKDLVYFLYDKLNLPVKGTTASGAPAVDTPTLKLIEDLHPVIPLLIKYKEIQKLLSTYTKSLYEKVMPDGRLYTELKDHGTSSGRLSSENLNFQQLPKNDTYKIRSLFKASEGYKMLVADFSQEEIRVCGVIINSETFKKAFENNLDLHLKVANEVWNLGIPEEILITTHPDYKKYKEKYDKKRFYAKSITFGLMYGRTAHGLAPQLKCSVEEAQKIVDEYFETYPEIKKAIEQTNNEVKKNHYVRNMFKRKRRFFANDKGFFNKSVFKQAFNFKIQGSCADILRIVMNKLYEYIKTTNDEVRMLFTVHDEVVFEIKDNQNLNKHIKEIINIMENTVKLPIPLKVDWDIGENYGEAK